MNALPSPRLQQDKSRQWQGESCSWQDPNPALQQERLAIRPMCLADVGQVVAIDRISFAMPWPESAYVFELKNNPTSLLWVAEIEHKAEVDSPSQTQIVGMIVVWSIVDEAHIATIAVLPDYRARGIAKILLATAMHESIHRGAKIATLEVRANNLAAQKLYQRFHFEVVGHRPRYYRDNNEDALIMTVSGLDQAYLSWLESGAWQTPLDTSLGGAPLRSD